jgi:hypothetical protein
LFLLKLKTQKIAFSYISNDALKHLRKMVQSVYFKTMSSKRLDIDFLDGLNELKVLRVYGRIKNLENIIKKYRKNIF